MKLSQRLAFMTRPPQAVGADGSPPVGRSSVVWTRTWDLDVAARPASLLEVAPSGFDALRLPTADGVARGLGQLVSDPRPPTEVPAIVVDLETSGLGAACIPFIVALAWHRAPGEVRLTQWSIAHASAERAMLVQVVECLQQIVAPLRPGPHLLSFNGRSFDLPRLRARARRLSVDHRGTFDLPHVDLVHPSRRLFKGRWTDCRLGTLEHEVLGVRRRGDLDGAEIAELFEQLQSHPEDDWLVGQLGAARRHNRGDVLSLLALACAAAQRCTTPTDRLEVLRVARHYLTLNRLDDAARCLSEPVRQAMAEQDADGPQRELARQLVMLAAEIHRRGGAFERAAELWAWVCQCFAGDEQAHEALAKHLEHRARDPAGALAVATASSSPCAHRLARLRRKLPVHAES